MMGIVVAHKTTPTIIPSNRPHPPKILSHNQWQRLSFVRRDSATHRHINFGDFIKYITKLYRILLIIAHKSNGLFIA